MKDARKRARRGLLAAFVTIVIGGAYYIRAEPAQAAGQCPVCHTEGIALPEPDQLSKCECKKWWNGQAPARLMFADCSSRHCAESGPQQLVENEGPESVPLVYVDLQLYRCPKDGLLFTDPE